MSLARLNLVLDFQPPSDGSVGSITVQGGTTYSEIAKYLAVGRRGALRNLPSCPQFTVAGAIATGTHGSGVHIPNLAADVSMIEFVRADGTLVRYSRETDAATLEGCRVHLGCLGVISELRLDVVPFFEVDARTYADVPLEAAVRALPELWTRCDSLSVWTSGFGRGGAEVGDSDLLKLADPFPRLEPLGAVPGAAAAGSRCAGTRPLRHGTGKWYIWYCNTSLGNVNVNTDEKSLQPAKNHRRVACSELQKVDFSLSTHTVRMTQLSKCYDTGHRARDGRATSDSWVGLQLARQRI